MQVEQDLSTAESPFFRKKIRLPDFLCLGIFLLSFILRLDLSLNNRQANDNHIEVIQLILSTGRLPKAEDCYECFQPKLFTFTVAKTVQLLGLEGLSKHELALAAQLINFLAGLVIMGLVWLMIRRVPTRNAWLKVLAFGLVALNPQMIGINSQATNDTFAILFSCLAIYGTVLFFKRPKLLTLLLSAIFTSLGIISKTNAWVTAVAIGISLFIYWFKSRAYRKKTWIFWFVFVLAVPLLVVVNPLSQYVGNQKAYGRPVLLNINTLPLPPLVGKTVHNDRGGILSIKDGFFTFRIASLLEYPRLSYEQEGYPPSRESFWTMMYASAQSANFPNYPPSWSTRGTQGFALTRGILVLGLIPTLLVLVGFFMEAGMIGKALLRRDLALAEAANYGLFVLATAGYVCFAILYALFYQTFLVMKGIFIFPAWLAYPVLFLRASDDLSNRVTRAALWIFTIIITILLLLYAADIVAIVIRIMRY